MTPEAIGKALAVTFLRQAEALASANLRAKDCRPDKSVDQRTGDLLRSLDKEIDDAAERIDDASEKGCVLAAQPYDQSYAFYLFRALKQGLTSKEPLVRWNVLERLRWICDNRDILPDVADRQCKAEVEDAALQVLSADSDVSNREHALEFLGEGYASMKAEPTLRAVLAANKSPREKDLAQQALDRISSGKQ